VRQDSDNATALNHTASVPVQSVDPVKLATWQRTQAELVGQLVVEPLDLALLRTVAGVDISFSPSSNTAIASLVVFPYPLTRTSKPLYIDFYSAPMTEPYCAGYLGFRELPHLRALFSRFALARPELYPPGVTLVDGNGVWHPRGLGSASHLGVALDIPTLGVAKTFYHLEDVGIDHAMMKALSRDEEPIVGTDGKTYGMALKTGGSQRHVFVSVGHRCDLASAVEVVKCCSFFRIPEPIRHADLESRRVIREQGL
jgi:deoxyinosine 3'endonuclease (endonuclease V)